MNGIIVGDLENVIKKTRFISDNVRNDIEKVSTSCSSLSECFANNAYDMKNNLNSDLQQFSKIINKINGCDNFLSGVLRAYQLQDESITYSLR